MQAGLSVSLVEGMEISHVLKAVGLDEKLAKGTIRISLGKYNTYDDVEKIVNGLKKAVGGDKLG